MSFRMPVLFLLLAVQNTWLGSTPVAAQARAAIGTYELVNAGTRQLPIMVSRIIPGEGTTLRSARLELMSAGRLRGEIVVSFTDSGTVTDTILADGRWRADGDTVRLTYQWSRPRWEGGTRVFEPAQPVAGTVIGSELILPEFAYFNDDFFGHAAPLHFRRVR